MADGEDRLREQPKVYENSKEGKKLLIKWLKQDLEDQKTQGIADEELTLNIGKDGVSVSINFDFNFYDIISNNDITSKLSKIKDENGRDIYLYEINCYEVNFIESVTFYQVTFPSQVDFSNAIFNKDADFRSATFNKDPQFRSTIFKNYVNFSDAKFRYYAYFNSATFRNYADFRSATFTNYVDFRSVIFTNYADFDSATFKNKVDFSDATFRNYADFDSVAFKNAEFYQVCFAGKTTFRKACFTKKADFRQTNFKKIICLKLNSQKIDLQKAIFREIDFQKVDFSGATFIQKTDFSFSIFQKKAIFNKTRFNKCKFSRATFEQEANFESAVFEKKAYFGLSREEHESNPNPKTTFEQKANFKRADFKDEADFKYVIFEEKVNFTYAIFRDEADFKFSSFNYKNENENENEPNSFCYATFKERGAFYNITLLGTLYFNNIIMVDKTNIYFDETNGNIEIDNDKYKKIPNMECPKIKITNTIISGRINLGNANVVKIDFKTSRVVGSGSVTNTIDNLADKFDNLVDKFDNWETANLFKSEEIKGVNTIKALEYKAKEKELYQKELLGKKNKSFRERAEIVSLALSKLSNDHGQSWFRAVVFTLLSGLIFCTIYSLIKHFDPNAVIAFITNLIENPEQITFSDFFIPQQTFFENFLIPLTKIYVPIDYSIITGYPNKLVANGARDFIAILFYFIGKIAVSYGMVEIIQAFRKLK